MRLAEMHFIEARQSSMKYASFKRRKVRKALPGSPHAVRNARKRCVVQVAMHTVERGQRYFFVFLAMLASAWRSF